MIEVHSSCAYSTSKIT